MSGLLDGKVAVVTGSGRGLGKAYARALAAAGAAVEVVPLDETVEMSPADPPADTGTGGRQEDAQTDVNETLPGDLGEAENDAQVSLELESSLPRRRA